MKTAVRKSSSLDSSSKRRAGNRNPPSRLSTGPSVSPTHDPHMESKSTREWSGGRPSCQNTIPVQASLTVSQPNDKYEQEADRGAEQVMRMPEPKIQAQGEEEEEESIQTNPLVDQITPLIQRRLEPEDEEEEELLQAKLADDMQVQRQEKEEEEEEEPVQTKRDSGKTAFVRQRPASQVSSLRGSGRPLPRSVRNFYEPRFGYDFSKVRVYADSDAAEAARTLNAKAFTHGRDIVFGAGQYAPGTRKGQQLLAHELAHVVQNRSSVVGHNEIRRVYDISENVKSVVLKDVPWVANELFFEARVGDRLHEELRIPKRWLPDLFKFRSNFERDVYNVLSQRKKPPLTVTIVADFQRGANIDQSKLLFGVLDVSYQETSVLSTAQAAAGKSRGAREQKVEDIPVVQPLERLKPELPEHLIHFLHDLQETLHLGTVLTELAAESMAFSNSVAWAAGTGLLGISGGLLIAVLAIFEVFKAMKAGVRLAAVQSASYAIVAIANKMKPPDPYSYMSSESAKAWREVASYVENGFKGILRMGGMWSAYVAGYLYAVNKMHPENAVNSIYQAFVEEHLSERYFFGLFKGGHLYSLARDIRLSWPLPRKTLGTEPLR